MMAGEIENCSSIEEDISIMQRISRGKPVFSTNPSNHYLTTLSHGENGRGWRYAMFLKAGICCAVNKSTEISSLDIISAQVFG